MKSTRFIDHMLSQKPTLVETIAHEKFSSACKQIKEYASLANGGRIYLVTGPSQAGKTTVLRFLIRFLKERLYKDLEEKWRPVVGMTAGTSQDGKVRIKYILSELLRDLGHPLFDFEKINLAGGYRPSKRLDESSLLSMTVDGLRTNRTLFALIDEAQFLTEHRDPKLKGAILESLKSLASSSTDVVLFGGYQLLIEIESLKSHLASRTTTVVVDRYHETDADLAAWKQILASISDSPKLRLSEPTILIRNAEQLLVESLGVIGIMEKRILHMAQLGPTITQRSFAESRPTRKKIETILEDIRMGEEHISDIFCANRRYDVPEIGKEGSAEDAPDTARQEGKKATNRPKPFQRKASRATPKIGA